MPEASSKITPKLAPERWQGPDASPSAAADGGLGAITKDDYMLTATRRLNERMRAAGGAATATILNRN